MQHYGMIEYLLYAMIGMVLNDIVLYSMVRYGTVRYGMI